MRLLSEMECAAEELAVAALGHVSQTVTEQSTANHAEVPDGHAAR